MRASLRYTLAGLRSSRLQVGVAIGVLAARKRTRSLDGIDKITPHYANVCPSHCLVGFVRLLSCAMYTLGLAPACSRPVRAHRCEAAHVSTFGRYGSRSEQLDGTIARARQLTARAAPAPTVERLGDGAAADPIPLEEQTAFEKLGVDGRLTVRRSCSALRLSIACVQPGTRGVAVALHTH